MNMPKSEVKHTMAVNAEDLQHVLLFLEDFRSDNYCPNTPFTVDDFPTLRDAVDGLSGALRDYADTTPSFLDHYLGIK